MLTHLQRWNFPPILNFSPPCVQTLSSIRTLHYQHTFCLTTLSSLLDATATAYKKRLCTGKLKMGRHDNTTCGFSLMCLWFSCFYRLTYHMGKSPRHGCDIVDVELNLNHSFIHMGKIVNIVYIFHKFDDFYFFLPFKWQWKNWPYHHKYLNVLHTVSHLTMQFNCSYYVIYVNYNVELTNYYWGIQTCR